MQGLKAGSCEKYNVEGTTQVTEMARTCEFCAEWWKKKRAGVAAFYMKCLPRSIRITFKLRSYVPYAERMLQRCGLRSIFQRSATINRESYGIRAGKGPFAPVADSSSTRRSPRYQLS